MQPDRKIQINNIQLNYYLIATLWKGPLASYDQRKGGGCVCVWNSGQRGIPLKGVSHPKKGHWSPYVSLQQHLHLHSLKIIVLKSLLSHIFIIPQILVSANEIPIYSSTSDMPMETPSTNLPKVLDSTIQKLISKYINIWTNKESDPSRKNN